MQIRRQKYLNVVKERERKGVKLESCLTTYQSHLGSNKNNYLLNFNN